MALEEFRLRFGKVLMELVGTACLVMTIQLTVGAGNEFAPFAIGVVLMIAVYMGGPISGGHYNPAVSLACFIRGALTFDNLLLYWIFQVIGGLCGALLGGLIGGKAVAISRGADYYLLQAFLAELVFTALLCLTVLATATNSKVEGNSYYGAAIGSVVMVGAFSVAPISGAAFNPAVAFSLSLIHGINKVAYMLWIVLAQAAGAVAGAFLFYLVAPDEFSHFGDEVHQFVGGVVDEASARLLPSRT